MTEDQMMTGWLKGLHPRRMFARLRGDESGVSAVEFALILPLMLTIYFGTIDVSQMMSAKRKLSHSTSALGDLITQYSKLTGPEMENILDASSAIMAPFPDANLAIVVSGVWVDDKGNATVTWSEARNATKLGKGSPVTLPANMNASDTGLVMAELSYTYKPQIGYVVTGTFNLEDRFFLRPRVGDEVEYSK
ncbi:MAG: TadE/TadG family type IV pilus assembly protein [Hyphomicrobiales bacterium]